MVAQSEEHSPGKRKVPGSNPGRSLGHFFSSVISQYGFPATQIADFVTGSDIAILLLLLIYRFHSLIVLKSTHAILGFV